ncbi:hypothetical protein [uncultured Amnibacterium sp.]|uniref:hypothetical protein n=1 Tax=uncultured Amnibacterium sp. TaxID=1631851 RepID=UPI0035C98B41
MATFQTRRDRTQLLIALPVAVLAMGIVIGLNSFQHSAQLDSARTSLQKVSPHHAAWKAYPAASVDAPKDCTSADVQISAGDVGGAMQRVQVPVKVENSSDAACTFDTSSVTLSSGARAELVTTDDAASVVVPANSSTTIAYSTPAVCDGTIVEASKDVSGDLRTDDGTGLSATTVVPSAIQKCGELQAVPVTSTSPQDDGTGQLSSLRAAIVIPAEPVQGDEFHYIVRLSNQSTASFTFDHCPTIEQSLHYTSSESQLATVLNCQTSESLAPGSSADFEMVVPSQRDGTGLTAIAWSLTDGPSAAIRL